MPTPLVIDLSHHNVIPHDLNDARAAGIAGIIHKATEGTKVVDPKCRARYSLAKDAGMLWGIYHFLRPSPPKNPNIGQQVDHFLSSTIWDSGSVLVCDFEVNGIPLDDVLQFLELVEASASQKPVLYSGNTLKEAGGASKLKELAEYRLWIAQYNNKGPTLPKGYKNWWLWQYSEKGKVAGIEGPVDLNAYNGTDLKNDWVIKTLAAAPAASAPNGDPAVQDPKAQTNPTNTEQPPIDHKEIKAEITPEGGVKMSSSEGTPAPKERIAVVKTKPKTWTQAIIAKITTAVTGNALFQWLWSQQDRLTGMSLPDAVWIIVSLTIAIGFLLWIVYEIIATYRWNKYQENIDALLVKENSTADNLVQLIPADEVDLYRAKGFKIITRGESAAGTQK